MLRKVMCSMIEQGGCNHRHYVMSLLDLSVLGLLCVVVSEYVDAHVQLRGKGNVHQLVPTV